MRQTTVIAIGTALCAFVIAAHAQQPRSASDTAADHHARGVAHHLERSLDAASREYARALQIEPPRDLTPEEWTMVRRFAPRIYTTASEFFPLKDVAVIVHPNSRVIAYHFFWEDDIDFPEDNDPCDHELIWVQYSADKQRLERLWTYFHGRILSGGNAAIVDARQHAMRPRVNVQWGKHGSMPEGWQPLPIQVNDGDAERDLLPRDRPITLADYNQAAFRKLHEQGRRLIDDPIARRLRWPERFAGDWAAFVDFSRLIDPLTLLDQTKMAKVSRWNSATINRHFLTYNFRPKTEWPTA